MKNQTNSKSLKVRTTIKAGSMANHNQTVVRPQAKSGLRVRTAVKAGSMANHNQTVVRG
jgi:hypothetical protein